VGRGQTSGGGRPLGFEADRNGFCRNSYEQRSLAVSLGSQLVSDAFVGAVVRANRYLEKYAFVIQVIRLQNNSLSVENYKDRLCGLVVGVLATDTEVPGSIDGATRFSGN
jgi:hypothetical protein